MNVKETAKTLVESLPDDATWEDLIYQVYVLESIEKGLEASAEDRVFASDEVRRRLNLPIK